MKKRIFRSQQWFDDPANPDMTALYLEKYLNFGLTLDELQAGKPLIGIAQTGSDLVPCNRIHQQLVERVKAGIRDAGGIPLEFPVHPIQETGRRPTAALDRNLQCLSLTEVLHGYPLDGVVLTTGCDKTTPALLMAAATVDLPAIALSGGPMLNGRYQGQCVGSGTIIWQARKQLAQGEIDYAGFIRQVASSAPSAGHCNTMGTALTMNALAEALGMMLPGGAAIPAPYRERAQLAYQTGRQIVALTLADVKPSQILTRPAFLNAIRLCSALGGSSNAPVHINAIAKHAGVELSMADWQHYGQQVPLLVNMQPVGEYLSEEFFHAGGVPAVAQQLLAHGLYDGDCLTVSGQSQAENLRQSQILDARVIKTVTAPLKAAAGFLVLSGNLCRSAVMKVSAIDEAFRRQYLSDPAAPGVMTLRAVVFDGPEHYHAAIDDPALNIDERCMLVMRNCGPQGYPGSAEVVNMRPPAYLLARGIQALPTMGDGRQSGTSGAPSVLNMSPEAAAGGPLALLQSGDLVRLDLANARLDMLVDAAELARRQQTPAFVQPASQTWWQQLYRAQVSQLDEGAVFEDMTRYQQVGQQLPRHSH